MIPNIMTLVPKREYILLLFGDIAVFIAALWLTLAVRSLSIPTTGLFKMHLVPFSLLFITWTIVFFLAGLYGRHTRLFKSKLLSSILYAQILNVVIAALFFFFISAYGIAPKTVLFLYLGISFVLIVGWRVVLFPRLRTVRKLKGVLLASGPDSKALAEEVAEGRYSFSFHYIIDTASAPTHQIIQQVLRVAEEDDITFLVVDFSDRSVSAALPIMYDAAFHKHRFALLDAVDLYQELFEREPLSLITYEWVLSNISASRIYDTVKRAIDVFGAICIGLISLPVYPFIIAAIKLDDGGDIFITQNRVGRFQQPIRIFKFRSMSGNDDGAYDESGKSKLKVTRVGRWLRILRIDELPQLWNVLRGELSLVGPRPELPALANQYNARIPYYNARYLVAPGLAGWAQVKHDRDPHHGADITETKEKLSYDLYYLKHRSLLLDIFIIFQTVRIIFTARGT
jgi:lipopolysaccharide/colanic/teichoic acid biosynthesis glycosyltransferase